MVARLEVFFWPDFGPVGGIRPGFGPVGGIFLEVYFSRWPGSGPAVRTFRRYLGEENGAMNREVRLFGSINAIT